MANITRKNQKVFAENVINNGQFGSLKDTTKVLSQDLDVLQANAAYPLGWNSATLTGEELPSIEEFQSLNYINTSQTAYLLNKGIPEWVVDAEYFIGDIQREVAGTKIYRSITNNNIGNVLTDIVNWELLFDLGSTATETLKGLTILPKQITISNGTDTDHNIDFTAGNFNFDDGSGQGIMGAETGEIDALFGVGNGMLDVGVVAIDSTYHLFAITNLTTGISKPLASLSPTAPTMPVGYTKKRKIASLVTDGSANIRNGSYQFENDGSYRFTYDTPIFDQSATNPPTTAVTRTLTVPPSSIVITTLHLVDLTFDGTSMRALLSDLDNADVNASDSFQLSVRSTGVTTADGSCPVEVKTNSISQIRTRVSTTNADLDLNIITFGWKEFNL